jgi:carbon monoxide dehydrogenase subunit G
MAKISVNDTVAYPRELVFHTFREDLEKLDDYLPDIESITTKSREDIDDNTTKIVRVWKARDEDIPKLASKFIKPEMLQWTDHATWREDEWTCKWEMEVGFLTDAITAKGTNRYIDKGDKVEIIIDGTLEVDAKQIPGVPGLLAGKVGSAVEGFVVKMITPNLKDVNRGVERYLAAHG